MDGCTISNRERCICPHGPACRRSRFSVSNSRRRNCTATRVEQAQAKQRELDKRLAKEKQFNRKVEINATVRQFKSELNGLKQ